MKYGIVGNRKGWTYNEVQKELLKLDITENDTIISGGAIGVDTYAQEFAKTIGCDMIIYYPRNSKPSPERYFERNKKIAKECDILIAFDKGNCSGTGTLNTINHAKRMGKQIIQITTLKVTKE